MNNDLIFLLAGMAAVFILSKKSTAATGNSGSSWVAPQAIPVAVSNGWQYFTDGTAISPDGLYYYKGELVYTP